MTQILNPYLYERLCEYYGDVEVVCPGQAIDWTLSWETPHGSTEARPVRKMNRSGEEYRVRCRKCRDHRARLYISHMWGVLDPDTGSRNLWMANCYNEQCYSDYQDQYWLFEIVYEASYVNNPNRTVEILPGRIGPSLSLQEVDWPGPTVRLDKLAQHVPNHHAISYLADRGFDTDKLAKMYKVGYCMSSHYRWATDRIVIPIFQKGMLVGWQTRYIGDNVDGVPFNQAGVPKYWTTPGMPKRLVAYNIEKALTHQTAVMVEGAADVWNTGKMAFGILGKTVSPEIYEMVVDGLKQHKDPLLVIALDPKQDEKSKERGKPHHSEVAYLQFRDALNGRVLKFKWPDPELDPGEIDRDWFRSLIIQQAAEFDMKATFSKPRLQL